MKLTQHNVSSVLGVAPESLGQVLPQVFNLLVDPGLDEMALFHYVQTIQKQMKMDADGRLDGDMGFSHYGICAFQAGFVEAMMVITQDPRTGRWHGLSSYFAMDAIWQLNRTGTSAERRTLLKKLLEHDALNICIDKIQRHPLLVNRQGAACLLKCLTAEGFLGEMISSHQTSDLMVVLCNHILAGPDFYEKQLADPQLTWQSFLCFGKFGASPTMASKYAPRYYAMSQENAAWAIQGLLNRCPPPSQHFCYEILSRNTNLFALLSQCGAIPRPPWYPDLQVNSTICEALVMFYRVPWLRIPGVLVKLNHPSQQEVDKEWGAVISSTKLLASQQPNWAQGILRLWDMFTDEKWPEIRSMFREVFRKYHAQTKYTEDEIMVVFTHRGQGSCRICIERLITTLLHCGNEFTVSNTDLLSLLRIGNAASQDPEMIFDRIPTRAEQGKQIERNHEHFNMPYYAIFTKDEVEPPLQVANESVMGPTLYVRILTLLAQRGVLQNISTMTTLPDGVDHRATLSHIQDIAGSHGISRFLVLALKRVTKRREMGHRRLTKDDDMDHACVAYFTAAELAAGLVGFDVATGKHYSLHLKGVRRELVLCLGNTAEMALCLQQYERALYFASGAVQAAQDLPDEGDLDAVDGGIKAKNRRRVARAQIGLSLLSAQRS